MKFVHGVLTHYRVAPSKLWGVAWRTVLGFKALYTLSILKSCQHKIFSAAYTLRKTSQDAHYFVPHSECEKFIINMVDSDQGMRDIVVRVTAQWEAESEDEREAIPITWNLGLVTRGGALLSVDVEAKLRKLATINYNHHN